MINMFMFIGLILTTVLIMGCLWFGNYYEKREAEKNKKAVEESKESKEKEKEPEREGMYMSMEAREKLIEIFWERARRIHKMDVRTLLELKRYFSREYLSSLVSNYDYVISYRTLQDLLGRLNYLEAVLDIYGKELETKLGYRFLKERLQNYREFYMQFCKEVR